MAKWLNVAESYYETETLTMKFTELKSTKTVKQQRLWNNKVYVSLEV